MSLNITPAGLSFAASRKKRTPEEKALKVALHMLTAANNRPLVTGPNADSYIYANKTFVLPTKPTDRNLFAVRSRDVISQVPYVVLRTRDPVYKNDLDSYAIRVLPHLANQPEVLARLRQTPGFYPKMELLKELAMRTNVHLDCPRNDNNPSAAVWIDDPNGQCKVSVGRYPQGLNTGQQSAALRLNPAPAARRRLSELAKGLMKRLDEVSP